ncbi:wax ester/triacylglycerol synthase domain-containing protein [Streptomyces sp. UC1A3]
MTRPHPGTDGRLPPSLAMGTADVAFHLAAGGRPLPVVFAFGFEGRAPTLDSVRARVAERVHRVPTSRYRIARDRRRFRRVDRIEADRHVHEAWLPEDTDGSATGRLMLSRPLATDDRPAWDVWLVHGPAGRHTLVYRTDHAYQDGVGAAWTARALLGDDPGGGPVPRPAARPTARGLADALAEVAAAFRAPTAKPAFDGVSTGRVDVCHTRTPLARLRAVARAHGGTVTDVYLAALSHAVRTWYLKDTGRVHPPLPVSIPMSVRTPGRSSPRATAWSPRGSCCPATRSHRGGHWPGSWPPPAGCARAGGATPCGCCWPPRPGRSVPASVPGSCTAPSSPGRSAAWTSARPSSTRGSRPGTRRSSPASPRASGA